jgi:hypothetical protein
MINFEDIWKKYPLRVGRKLAERYFKSSVKTDKDFEDINKALKNYLKSKRVQDGFVQDGKTWFNNWKDWVDFSDIMPKEEPEESKVLQKFKR